MPADNSEISPAKLGITLSIFVPLGWHKNSETWFRSMDLWVTMLLRI